MGSAQHVEYNVNIAIGGDSPVSWSIMRRFRQFRDLHRSLIQAYGNLNLWITYSTAQVKHQGN